MKEIIDKIGMPATLEQLAEETAELGQASLKLARKIRDENPTPKLFGECLSNFIEEIGDVLLVVNMLVESGFISYEAIDSSIMAKEERWKKRLGIEVDSVE